MDAARRTEAVGIRRLKNHLSEYVRRVRGGEVIPVSLHGEVVAELGPPRPEPAEQVPEGLQALVRKGIARGIVLNDPGRYRARKKMLKGTTAQALLDADRDER